MNMKHIVGFSGGIDSQACARWVRQRNDPADVILMNTNAGDNEHPITEAFIDWYSVNIFPVVKVPCLIKDLQGIGTKYGGTRERRATLGEDENAPLTFPMLAFVKGIFPSRKAQFCTKILKLEPQKRWIKENLEANGIDYVRYTGVRADESEDRKALPRKSWDEWFDCELVRPLIKWTKKRCFEYVQNAGEDFNPLYKLGFSRVGCAPCINSGKDDVRNWAARFPDMIDKVRQWEKEVGRTFFAPIVPGKVINWIDEVVAWSKTARGGSHYAFAVRGSGSRSGNLFEQIWAMRMNRNIFDRVFRWLDPCVFFSGVRRMEIRCPNCTRKLSFVGYRDLPQGRPPMDHTGADSLQGKPDPRPVVQVAVFQCNGCRSMKFVKEEAK